MGKGDIFLGMEARAPWPPEYPPGRIVDERDRHLTLLLLGDGDATSLSALMAQAPKPPFSIGLAAIMDRLLFLPEETPHVVAAHIDLLERAQELERFRTEMMDWFKAHQLTLAKEEHFLPHITLAREPFNRSQWTDSFEMLPLYLHAITLYESLGHSHYRTLWTHPLQAPFEEVAHTADMAFSIIGTNYSDLFLHAWLALAFEFPSLLRYRCDFKPDSLDTLVFQLNRLIARIDAEEGCPIKAISAHSQLLNQNGQLTWEMIVDV